MPATSSRTFSILPVMWNAEPTAPLTAESISEAENAAIKQSQEVDAENKKRREAKGYSGWESELATLELRYGSVGSVGNVRARVTDRNREHDERVSDIESKISECRNILSSGTDLFLRGTVEKKLPKLEHALANAKRQAEIARGVGAQSVRSATEIVTSADFQRLLELRKLEKQRVNALARVKSL